jgi:hypothetical protein
LTSAYPGAFGHSRRLIASFGKLAAGDRDGNAVGSDPVDLNRLAAGALGRQKMRRDTDLSNCK